MKKISISEAKIKLEGVIEAMEKMREETRKTREEIEQLADQLKRTNELLNKAKMIQLGTGGRL